MADHTNPRQATSACHSASRSHSFLVVGFDSLLTNYKYSWRYNRLALIRRNPEVTDEGHLSAPGGYSIRR